MIHGQIKDYKKLPISDERLKKGLKVLAETDWTTWELGRHEIDGTDIFVLITSYKTKTEEEAVLEGHKKYLDIQYTVKGKEVIGCGFFQEDTKVVSESDEKDLYFYTGKGFWVPMNPEVFLVLYPEDLHAPGVTAPGETPEDIIKVVMKIRV